MKKQILIGIDIGIWKNTGVAIYDPKAKEFILIESMDFFDAMAKIKGIYINPDYDIIVVVENADLSSNVFGADVTLVNFIKGWMAKPIKDWKGLTSKIRMVITWGTNVGKNKGIAVSFCKKLREIGIATVEINPSDRRVAGSTVKVGKIEQVIPLNQLPMPTKVKSEDFIKLTGYTKQTNDHGRDAATLLWKKTFMFYKNFARTQAINLLNKKKDVAKKRSLKRK